MTTRHSFLAFLAAGLVAGAAAAPARAQVGCAETLTLRVSDAVAEPGGLVAVVLRTYASRPVGQGQVDLRLRTAAPGVAGGCAGCLVQPAAQGAEPIVALEDFAVFASLEDASVSGILEDGPEGPVASLAFDSPSGTINQHDGPLAVYWLRLSPDVLPGEVIPLEIVPGPSFLAGSGGAPIPLELRGGELLVRAPDDPRLLEADGDDVVGGQLAALAVETQESFAIWSGQVALTWDSAIAVGEPEVSMDDRHGEATFQIEESAPGRVVVSFASADGSLNEVPGAIVQIGLRIAGDADGPPVPLVLDPAATFLVGDGGGLPLVLGSDEITFDGDHTVFRDGFECGGVGRWSLAL
jgi:hypothetical protein